MIRRIIFATMTLILFSCGKKNEIPKEFLQPAKMQSVLWDIIRADALTTQQLKTFTTPEATATNIKFQKQVFVIHGVTKDDFYNSLAYYKEHPAIMKTLMDSVVSLANRQKSLILPINPNLVK